jgi:hypothetical protein
MERDFVGIQVGPVSFLDEGVEAVLDTLQEKAAVNSLVVAPLTWDQSVAGRASYGEPGHGVVGSQSIVGGAFWNPNPAYYQHSLLADFRTPDPLFAGFDVMEAVVPVARQRGMAVYPYLFETGIPDRPVSVPNFGRVVEVDAYGRTAARPCVHNPDYKTWIMAVVEDLCRSFDIEGILWGIERQGPLMSMLEGGVPTCFCEHCQSRAARQGIDAGRAREGYQKLHGYLLGLRAGESPRDGYLVSFLRLILQYPEVLQWEKLWLDGHKAFYREIYGLVKFLDPAKEVGLSIWYRITTTNPYLRAQYDYTELKGVCDWVKPILYNVPSGARFALLMQHLTATILKDAAGDAWAAGLQKILQHDEAPLHELPSRGFSAEYVRRETARVAAALDDAAKVYPAIGIGMRNPGGREIQPADVQPAIEAAYAGGADGVLLCRMYAEISLACLEAAGRAIRALGRG